MAVSKVLTYVRNSVPDAIRNLGPSQAQLETMARAKISDALTRRDALTDALRDAGAPVR
ncbi:MAG: hypothetical protein Q4G49_13535 [Paracoccus sp. (in: a-proteobacteria)]|nr:hypothetical protein [Paracoccus sp. (in: a-proteobacteria)]